MPIKKKKQKRKCLHCGDEVIGRSDKRFCCTDCRTQYNNAVNRNANLFVSKINRILKRNRRILAEMCPNGKSRTTREKLLTAGFNFNYFTNEYNTKSGNLYKFCYEYGYIQLPKGGYAVVLRREYVE